MRDSDPVQSRQVASAILAALGPGSMLLIGAGTEAIAARLRAMGIVVDAPTEAREVERALSSADAYDSTVALGWLDPQPIEDVGASLRRLVRATRRNLILRTANEGDARPMAEHIRRSTSWWLERAAVAGMELHPRGRFYAAVSAAGGENAGTLVLRKRRSERAESTFSTGVTAACMARRALCDIAAGMSRRGDHVLLSGADAPEAGEWIRESSSVDRVFVHGSGGDSEAFFDLAVALDACGAETVLNTARLTPGGRMFCFMDSGVAAKVLAGRDAASLLERVWSVRTADDRLLIEEVADVASAGSDARGHGSEGGPGWIIACLMRDPLEPSGAPYHQRWCPAYEQLQGHHVTSFQRDMRNPWLFRAVIDTGVRCSNPGLLDSICRRVLAQSEAGSPDYGAAACVLGYRALERDDPGVIDDVGTHVARSAEAAAESPHAWRWKISNMFLAGRFLETRGRHEEAIAAYLKLNTADYLRFSPLLASKPVEALWRAGRLLARMGRFDRAREALKAGLERAREAVTQPDWVNIWASVDAPLPWGMHDASIVLDLASRCGATLLELDGWPDRPAQSDFNSGRQSFADSREWIQTLTLSNQWLLGHAQSWERAARNAVQQVESLRAALNQGAVSEGTATDGRGLDQLESLRAWEQELRRGLEWSDRERTSLMERLAEAGRTLKRSEEWSAELKAGLDWANAERARLTETIASREREIEELRGWSSQLQDAVAWANRERASAVQMLEEQTAQIAKQKQAVETLEEGLRWSQSQRESLASEVLMRDTELRSLRDWAAELKKGLDWMREQRDYWQGLVESGSRGVAQPAANESKDGKPTEGTRS